MLRLFLPPNLPAAAARDALAVKVELALEKEIAPALAPACALLQRWCGGAPAPFLQLTRAQLRDLIEASRGQPIFFWVQKPQEPIAWSGLHLVGVSEHVRASVAPTPPPSGGNPPRSTARAPASSPPPSPVLRLDGSEEYLAAELLTREHPRHAEALELVRAHDFKLEPSNRRWWLRDRHKVLEFLAEHLHRLREAGWAEFTPNFSRRTAHLHLADIVCEVQPDREAFAVTLQVQAGSVDDGGVRRALDVGRHYLEENGRIYLLNHERVARLAQAQRALSGAETPLLARVTRRVRRTQLPEVEELLEELSPGFRPPESWRDQTAALRDTHRLLAAPLSEPLASALRPYQKLGAAWLWHLYRHELGGLLADEMGLGKTLQALALLSAVHRPAPAAEPPPAGPSLVVCPASLLENWRREASRWTPELRTLVHHGSRRATTAAAFGGHDLVVTSYGTLQRDRELFRDVTLSCLIADEAQHTKNRRSENAQAARALRARGRFLLTGTPLENSYDDLRSLLDLALPGYLGATPSAVKEVPPERLRAKAAPYLLRRTKAAVAPELPEKLEQTLWCDLTDAQRRRYEEMQRASEQRLLALATAGKSEGELRMAVLTELLRLRQICCDPRLVEAQADPAESAKLQALRELLQEAADGGHRVLVFSQFASMLQLIAEALEEDGLGHCLLDGSTLNRQAVIDRFNQDDSLPVFLISLKAGGVGLNLTAADTVVHYDPWWNPAAEAQATDRAHRIGQTKTVAVYRLFCTGTVEEKVLALQREKRQALASVFEASDAQALRLDLDDLSALLHP